MGGWTHEEAAYPGGQFRIYVTRRTRGGAQVNVTGFRGALTVIESFGSADPFGDAAAVLTFPTITMFDDLQGGDLQPWLAYYSDVDIFWVPSVPLEPDYPSIGKRINPLTNKADLGAPNMVRHLDAYTGARWAHKIYEGYIASMDFNDQTQLQVQCQGALFQADRYLQKPFFPARPWPLESLISDVFDRTKRPQLRTAPFRTIFPAGWTKRVPKYVGQSANIYSPVARPGTLWSGLTSRSTGSWEHALTGFVQNELANMIVDGDSGVTPGNQWTLLQRRATLTNPRGRQPVLQVRDRFRAPDFSLWLGTPGVTPRLSGDSTQSANVLYGDGQDIDGTTWRNAVINDDGSRTDYLPLAASRDVYPPNAKDADNVNGFVSESYVKFGTGFALDDAVSVAEGMRVRDQQPGWSGTIEVAVDPAPDFPKWYIQAGMTLLLKGFLGTGEAGYPFHISAVQANPSANTVSLTVDSRYRDLLTVAESIQRNRDPLTPQRMLQANRTSVMIEDIQAPWDYSAGSGFIPRGSIQFYKQKPSSEPWPQNDWVRRHPPLHFPNYYVKCKANASTPNGRWAGPIPILTSEKGTISRTEIFCVDAYGRPAKVPFHVSFYKTPVAVDNMPRQGGQSSPYIDGAFESVNPATGQEWPAGNFLKPDDMFIMGWGNKAAGKFQRAGFYPGSEQAGAAPSGLFADDTAWSFDNTDRPDYDRQAKPGVRQQTSAITIYAMFYAEHRSVVYFGGRLYRQNPGVG